MAENNSNSLSLLEKVAHFSTTLSSIAAIIAIGIGIWQFRIALNRTDQQIEYIKKDRILKLEESRPVVVVDSTNVSDLRYYPFDSWSFDIYFSNIGIRPATDIKIKNIIVATRSEEDVNYNKFKTQSAPLDSATEEFINPLTKGAQLVKGNFLDTSKLKNYYIKTIVSYNDKLLNRTFIDTYFYTLDVDETNIQYHAPPLELSSPNKKEARVIDSLVNKYYKEKKSN